MYTFDVWTVYLFPSSFYTSNSFIILNINNEQFLHMKTNVPQLIGVTMLLAGFLCLRKFARWAQACPHPHCNQPRHSQSKRSYVTACWSQQMVIPWWGYKLTDVFPTQKHFFYVAFVQPYLLSFYLMCEIKCACWEQEVTVVSLFHQMAKGQIQPMGPLKRYTILTKSKAPSVLQTNCTWLCHSTAGLSGLSKSPVRSNM